MAKEEGVEISEESEGDIEVEPVANQMVEISAVHSELDYDQEEVVNDNEEFERYNATVSEEPRAQIEEDPQSEDGYEQDREMNIESEEEAPASPPRQVIYKDTPAAKRRRRFKESQKGKNPARSGDKIGETKTW